jgi:hypothetical protein
MFVTPDISMVFTRIFWLEPFVDYSLRFSLSSTSEHAHVVQWEKKKYIENEDRNGKYLFMFYLSIKFKSYNLFHNNHDIYSIVYDNIY